MAVDIRTTPESPVLKWGFVLLTAYTGVVGAFLYVLGCREPLPGLHERYVAAQWRQALGSTMHCVAGDGVGILAGAVSSSIFGIAGLAEIVLEYVLGFAFGWTIFQALFMRDMAGGSYRRALASTFMSGAAVDEFADGGNGADSDGAEGAIPAAADPTTPSFWFVMSMGLLVGFIVAYPMNWWLVALPSQARHDDGAAESGVSCRRGVSSQQSRRARANGPRATNEWYGDGCPHAAAATRRRDDPDLVHRTRERSVARIVRSTALGSALDAHDLNKLGRTFAKAASGATSPPDLASAKDRFPSPSRVLPAVRRAAILFECSSSPRPMPMQSAPSSTKRASCRPPSSCVGDFLGSPTTRRRGHTSGQSPDGSRHRLNHAR